MITQKEYEKAKQRVSDIFDSISIRYTNEENERIEVADFGLGRLTEFGLQILTYINTDRCCAKELVLFPNQICPEHIHPTIQGVPGKEETFRCRHGLVYLYVSGDKSSLIKGKIPVDKLDSFTVFHEIVLNPGEQYTLKPDTLHWFQGGPKGAVVSEFSTASNDDTDVFTDPEISRAPQVGK